MGMCHTHGSETYPWVTLVIPRSIVRTVRITNRVDCCGDKMKNVKVWVGNEFPSNSNVEFSEGTLLGAFSGLGTNGQVLPITSQTGIEGTHVVVQMRTNIINLAEIEVLGEPAPNIEYKITPLGAKMSSVWTGFPAEKCIDGIFKHAGPGNKRNLCHTAGGEKYPWIAVNIPRSQVDSVRIHNRYRCPWDDQTLEVYQRTRNIKVRVAYNIPTTADSPFTEGTLLGEEYKGPAKIGEKIEIHSTEPIFGTWVIVQMENTHSINLVEIEVFSKRGTGEQPSRIELLIDESQLLCPGEKPP